jgi:hypothetical protein
MKPQHILIKDCVIILWIKDAAYLLEQDRGRLTFNCRPFSESEQVQWTRDFPNVARIDGPENPFTAIHVWVRKEHTARQALQVARLVGLYIFRYHITILQKK